MDFKHVDPKNANVIVGKKYRLKEQLGKGSFGQIFRGVIKGTDTQVAVKIEKKQTSTTILQKESKIISDLNADAGFPHLIAYGKEENYQYLVMTLLGPNLGTLLKECRGKLNLKTTLMLADLILTRIETLHKHGYVHRDIKPDNFLIGRGATEKNIYLIDFGLSVPYKDPLDRHINFDVNRGLVGTARYASINAHMGYELSRRDDLESIGYMLIYFMNGKLPWQSAKGGTKQEKYKLIADMKLNLSIETLCRDLPKEFVIYMATVKKLGFQETPNYKYLRAIFKTLFIEKGFDFDYCYSWVKYQTSDTRSIQSKTSKADYEEAQHTLAMPDKWDKAKKDLENKMGNAVDTQNMNSKEKYYNDIKFEGPFIVKSSKGRIIAASYNQIASNTHDSSDEEIPIEIDPKSSLNQRVQNAVYMRFGEIVLPKQSTYLLSSVGFGSAPPKERVKKQKSSIIIGRNTHHLGDDLEKFSIPRSRTVKGSDGGHSDYSASESMT